jgi:hypothetical protein
MVYKRDEWKEMHVDIEEVHAEGKFGLVVTPIAQRSHVADASQTQQSLTDNTGGTASTTLADCAGADNVSEAAIENNFASIAAQLAKVKTDVGNLVTKVNSILATLEAFGFHKTS